MKLYLLFLILYSLSLSSCVEYPSFDSSNFLTEANKKLQAVYAQQTPPAIAPSFPTYGNIAPTTPQHYGIASTTSNLFANVEEINKRLEALQKMSPSAGTMSWQSPSYNREFPSSPPVSSYTPQFPTYVASADSARNNGQFPDPLRGPVNSDTNYAIPTPSVRQMFAPKQYGILRQISSEQPIMQNSPPQPQSAPAVRYESPVYGGRPLTVSFGIQHGLEKAYPQPQYSIPAPPQQYQQSSLPSYPTSYQSQLKPNLIKAQSLFSSPGDDYNDYKFGGYKNGKNGIYGQETLYPDESYTGRYGFSGINFNKAQPVYRPVGYAPTQPNPISFDLSEGPAFKSFMESFRG